MCWLWAWGAIILQNLFGVQFLELFYGYTLLESLLTTYSITRKERGEGKLDKILQSWQSKDIFYKGCAMYLKLDYGKITYVLMIIQAV